MWSVWERSVHAEQLFCKLKTAVKQKNFFFLIKIIKAKSLEDCLGECYDSSHSKKTYPVLCGNGFRGPR